MYRSGVILAGGSSNRFGRDKALVDLLGKPLIIWVVDVVLEVVDEVFVVVSSQFQAETMREVVGSDISVLVDDRDLQGPLAGAFTGFDKASGECSLLLPCDTPLVSGEVIQYLFDLCEGRDAVVPRWPNGYIEPLQAVYRTEPALKTAQNALEEGRVDMRSMIGRLSKVRYISTLVLKKLNPTLRTFFNVNTPLDLQKVEFLLKSLDSNIHN